MLPESGFPRVRVARVLLDPSLGKKPKKTVKYFLVPQSFADGRCLHWRRKGRLYIGLPWLCDGSAPNEALQKFCVWYLMTAEFMENVIKER